MGTKVLLSPPSSALFDLCHILFEKSTNYLQRGKLLDCCPLDNENLGRVVHLQRAESHTFQLQWVNALSTCFFTSLLWVKFQFSDTYQTEQLSSCWWFEAWLTFRLPVLHRHPKICYRIKISQDITELNVFIYFTRIIKCLFYKWQDRNLSRSSVWPETETGTLYSISNSQENPVQFYPSHKTFKSFSGTEFSSL